MADWPGQEVPSQAWPGQELRRKTDHAESQSMQDLVTGTSGGPEALIGITPDSPNLSLTDVLRGAANNLMGNPAWQRKSVMDPSGSLQPAPFQVNPSTARAIGGTVASLEGPEATPYGVAAGAKVAHLINRAIGNPSDRGQTLGGSFLESATDIGTQYPFAIKSGLTRGIQQYLDKLDPYQQSIYRSPAANRAIQRVNDLKQAGIDPNLMVTGGSNAVGIANAQTKAPFTAGVWDQAKRDFEEQAGASFERTRNRLGTAVEKATAGDAALTGIDTYASKTEKVANRLYSRVRGINELPVDIGDMKQVAYDRLQTELQKAGGGDGATKRVLGDILTRGIKDPAKVQQVLDAVDKAAGKPPFALSFVMENQVPFQEARVLRSSLLGIGRQQQGLFPQGAQSTGKELSGLLNQSMEKSAAANLAPSQFKRWQMANDFYRQRADNLRAVDDIWKSKSGQDAYAKIVAGAKDGPAKFDAVFKIVPKEQKDEFLSVFLNELGKESGGAASNLAENASPMRSFNPVSFMTQWSSLPESVKQHVGGAMGQDLRDSLDRLARIGGYVKQSKFLSNPSGTAGANEFIKQMGPTGVAGTAIALQQFGHPGMAAGTVALPILSYASAKMMTNPAVVNWMAKGARIAASDTAGMATHMARLALIANQNPALASDIKDYIEAHQIESHGGR